MLPAVPNDLGLLVSFQLNDIDDGFCSLMDDNGETRDDIKVPETDVGADLKTRFEAGENLMATVLSACDEEMIVAVKQSK